MKSINIYPIITQKEYNEIKIINQISTEWNKSRDYEYRDFGPLSNIDSNFSDRKLCFDYAYNLIDYINKKFPKKEFLIIEPLEHGLLLIPISVAGVWHVNIGIYNRNKVLIGTIDPWWSIPGSKLTIKPKSIKSDPDINSFR